jgi:hypothetical protein
VIFDYRGVKELAEHILKQVADKAPVKSDNKPRPKIEGNKKQADLKATG